LPAGKPLQGPIEIGAELAPRGAIICQLESLLLHLSASSLRKGYPSRLHVRGGSGERCRGLQGGYKLKIKCQPGAEGKGKGGREGGIMALPDYRCRTHTHVDKHPVDMLGS